MSKRLSVRVADELYDSVRQLAKIEKRTLSNMVLSLLETGLGHHQAPVVLNEIPEHELAYYAEKAYKESARKAKKKPMKDGPVEESTGCPFKDKCFILARPDSNYCPGCKKVRKQ